MTLTSKQRAFLRGKASMMEPIFQIGKSSLTPEIITAVDDAIEKRELIKVSVLKNCMDDPRSIAEMLGERTHAQVIAVTGRKIVLYRPKKKDSKIQLPQ
ncbi:MAG: ribosome assembly RNA-binding protein YhbY [Lachnospiraceae bacterium]|nr:ribosome assembly RNA-binding protein YhbY [Lachnospiraceae bacterium]